MSDDTGYQRVATPSSVQGDFNSLLLMMQQVVARISTCTMVKIVAVTNSGSISPVGFVDVRPLVNQMDGSGNMIPHGVLHHLPYFRLQGGANAIILDPQVGDVGAAVFSDHDISTITATKKQGNPGSRRRFNMADGMYFGGLLNGNPNQTVQFSAAGITITSPNPVTVNCTNSVVNAANRQPSHRLRFPWERWVRRFLPL